MLDQTSRSRRAAAFAIGFAAFTTVPRGGSAATVTCNIPQPCALYTNAQGIGASGTSARSIGLAGTTTFAATSSANATDGVEGLDASTNKNRYNTGVYGYSPYGWGMRGVSPAGVGLYGASTSGTGLDATSSSGTAINASTTSGTAIVGASSTSNGVYGKTYGTSSTHAGVTGVDLATNGGYNDGVLGITTSGAYGVEGRASNGAYAGVSGTSTTGVGVSGSSASYIGIRGTSTGSFGVYGSSAGDVGVYGVGSSGVDGAGTAYGLVGTSTAGYGVFGQSSSGAGGVAQSVSGPGLSANSSSGDAIDATTAGGIGVYAINSNGNGADIKGSYIGVVARSGSFPILATDNSGADLFYVDASGDVYSHGTFRTFVATRGGTSTTAFTTRSTTPNVEDVGSGRLVNGIATIAFDAAFAASIDPHAIYHVFLTPNGDTRGLFVATKTPAGFVVRETQGGRGTLAFDYRIVAAAPGHAGERMALVGSTNASAPRAPSVTRRAIVAPARIVEPTIRRKAIR